MRLQCYKGEIDLLQKLKNVDRVVRLYDWEVDEQRQVLSVVSHPQIRVGASATRSESNILTPISLWNWGSLISPE
jgi:hypothetical protein